MLALPSQQRGVLASLGFTRAEADAAALAMDRSSRRYAGAAAIARALSAAAPPWPLVARLYGVPLLGLLADWSYRQVAIHRSLLARLWGDPPACDAPDADCVD